MNRYIILGTLFTILLGVIAFNINGQTTNQQTDIASYTRSAQPSSTSVQPTSLPEPDHGLTPQQGTGLSDQAYAGNASCADCHQEQQQLWQGSHHQQAMQHANEQTVKGNFNDQSLIILGQEHVFFRRDKQFFIRTEGPDGLPADYQVTYTFGTEPLQQYITAFPQGRLQMLPLAWDTLKLKWFHLQEQQQPEVGEWIHWTQGGMNWNSMCADCHTTHLQKNFDQATNSYATTWAEMNVGCEACHGPAKAHVDAMAKGLASKPLLDMTGNDNSVAVVEKCGRCHSRRRQLTPTYQHHDGELLDHYIPEIIRQGAYHADGQIEGEVFVYGSFVQSKMYHRGVSCNDCHDPHSNQLKQSGNALCSNCHQAEKYDSPSHHYHPITAAGSAASDESKRGSGNRCVDCHMPGKIYMGNDFRRDHSFRIPRPDLSVQHSTPNACNRCHLDQSPQWAANAVEAWHGKVRPKHFSQALTSGNSDPLAAIEPLQALLSDTAQPAIARASAALLLAPLAYQDNILQALEAGLKDPSSLLKASIANSIYAQPLSLKLPLLLPLLGDKTRAVRIASARSLIELSPQQLSTTQQQQFKLAKQEYRESLALNADFSSTRQQQALDFEKLGQLELAISHLQQAINIDNHNNNSRMNLAQLYYRQQQLDKVEALYREILRQEPTAPPALYSLGLLKAEQGASKEAITLIEQAALIGNNPRAWYNLAILHQQQQQPDKARDAYNNAISLAPGEIQFVQGLLSLYAQQQQWPQALKTINQALQQSPGNRQLLQLRYTIAAAARAQQSNR